MRAGLHAADYPMLEASPRDGGFLRPLSAPALTEASCVRGKTAPMDMRSDPLMALAERRLGWLESRQRVLAQNIANADTPNYQPQDLRDFAQTLAATGAGVPLAQTQPGHIAGAAGGSGARADRQVSERTPDGNAVSLDQQAMKVAETDTAHALAINLYRRYAAMYRTALGRAS